MHHAVVVIIIHDVHGRRIKCYPVLFQPLQKTFLPFFIVPVALRYCSCVMFGGRCSFVVLNQSLFHNMDKVECTYKIFINRNLRTTKDISVPDNLRTLTHLVAPDSPSTTLHQSLRAQRQMMQFDVCSCKRLPTVAFCFFQTYFDQFTRRGGPGMLRLCSLLIQLRFCSNPDLLRRRPAVCDCSSCSCVDSDSNQRDNLFTVSANQRSDK